MIKVLIGDIFESKAQTIVNTINCVGIMGKGLALAFKQKFPDMFKEYVEKCAKKQVKLGQPYLYKTLLPPWILNFPTKDHWRSMTNLQDIITGLEYLMHNYKKWEITSIAFPPLGCGEGQLEWKVVGPTLYRYLNKMDIPIELYAPYGTPAIQLEKNFFEDKDIFCSGAKPLDPKWIKPSWVALVEILKRIEEQPYHWSTGRVIFQKIAYIATQLGLPTELEYYKASYGPFSKQLKPLTTRLLNNGLIVEEEKERMFVVKTGPTFDDARKTYSGYLHQWENIIERTSDLFIRLNTKQAEIVSTVVFSADMLKKSSKKEPTENDVLNEIMKWKQKRKPPLEQNEIAKTIRNLGALGWLNVTPSADLVGLSDN